MLEALLAQIAILELGLAEAKVLALFAPLELQIQTQEAHLVLPVAHARQEVIQMQELALALNVVQVMQTQALEAPVFPHALFVVKEHIHPREPALVRIVPLENT